MVKSIKFALVTLTAALTLTACNDAQVASRNLSQAADNFEINRRVVFYNGITADYMLSIEGLCSLDADNARKVSITCKTGPSTFKKHYLGLSDNVTYFIEQLEPAGVSTFHYKVVFKPSVILPDIVVK
ncbi:beta-sandwich lipoprotein [Cupriavidus sp. IDO]|uniref:beta-sandwich lipoprotein n=1 Tax=Cupriavidus sp. IDO TaxID=1539142 RepID=UPI003FCD159C